MMSQIKSKRQKTSDINLEFIASVKQEDKFILTVTLYDLCFQKCNKKH